VPDPAPLGVRPIRAISFDLWDTLVVDDSDEPERARRGLPPKPAAREAAFVRLVGPGVPAARASAAWAEANEWFRHQWKIEHRTPGIGERAAVALRALGAPPPHPEAMRAFTDELARMEVEIPPRPCEGIHELLGALRARGYPLAVISDAIVTPGAQLRALLERHDLLHHFNVLIFSDEVGASKPAPLPFVRAAAALGVPVGSLVHVGDRVETDAAGARAVGARSVLYTGAVDRGPAPGDADVICADYAQLLPLLDRLAGPGPA
jgi:FMN phosphatase YigB (HAD superfamily)